MDIMESNILISYSYFISVRWAQNASVQSIVGILHMNYLFINIWTGWASARYTVYARAHIANSITQISIDIENIEKWRHMSAYVILISFAIHPG